MLKEVAISTIFGNYKVDTASKGKNGEKANKQAHPTSYRPRIEHAAD